MTQPSEGERARPDGVAAAIAVPALATAVWTVGSDVAPVADAATALIIPVMFALAGALGGLWRGALFTGRALTAVGSLHLFALALSAGAIATSGAWLHAASQVLFIAGFGVLVPLAAGYPAGPAPRWSWVVPGAALLIPALAAVSGPTPTVLGAGGSDVHLGPAIALLPAGFAAASVVVFALPVVAVATVVVRLLRGDTELRARLTLPLAALGGMAILIVAGALVPTTAAGVSTVLFLVAAPLVPVALIAGSRPVPARSRDESLEMAAVEIGALTPRERDVLAQMAAGASNQAIARSLHISLSAVEKHTTAIFAKLGLGAEQATHRRVAAVVAYLRAAR